MNLEVPKHPPPPPPTQKQPAPPPPTQKQPAPPPPTSKRLSRPKITLQIPDPVFRGPQSAASKHYTPRYHAWPPSSPVSHSSHPHVNPEWYMHMTHASDFIMNTAKSGLSFGEKTAFWFVSKLKLLSKRWFTHFFLIMCLVLYSAMGAGMFMALERGHEDIYDKKLEDLRRNLSKRLRLLALNNLTQLQDAHFDHLSLISEDLEYYETNVSECISQLTDNKINQKTWTFINAMFYAGTIYTSIDDEKHLTWDFTTSFVAKYERKR